MNTKGADYADAQAGDCTFVVRMHKIRFPGIEAHVEILLKDKKMN